MESIGMSWGGPWSPKDVSLLLLFLSLLILLLFLRLLLRLEVPGESSAVLLNGFGAPRWSLGGPFGSQERSLKSLECPWGSLGAPWASLGRSLGTFG